MPAAQTRTFEFTAAEIHELQAAVRNREIELKRKRASLETLDSPAGVQAIDDQLKTVKGDGPLRPGLRGKLGIIDKKDENQLEHGTGEGPDYATWDLTVTGTEELLTRVVSSNDPPAAKMRKLNALEDGEKEREPSRDGVLKAIRRTREALKDKVKPIIQGGGPDDGNDDID